MVTYMSTPQTKLTLGSTVYTGTVHHAKITRLENGFDSGTIDLTDISLCPTVVTAGTAIQLDVKDAGETAYTTIHKGKVRFPIVTSGENGEILRLSTLGSGYGLGQMLVATEYGTQSANASTDTPTEIATDIINNYVNKVLGGAASGFSYTISTSLANSITYVNFPYKPANAALNDLMDLTTAYQASVAGAGSHWIVTTDDVLHIKLVSATQVGWTKYYGDSQTNATLTEGVHIISEDFEVMDPEASYVVYFGAWRRPSNGDCWTENNATSWGAYDASVADDTDAGDFKVNTSSIKITSNSAVNPYASYYPSTQDLGIDLTYFESYNVPSLNFWIKRSAGIEGVVSLVDSSGNSFDYVFYESSGGTGPVQTAATWYHISLPVGYHYKVPGQEMWTDNGGADWSDIQFILFSGSHAQNEYLHIDGLHFGDANVCRVAYDSSISPYDMKLIVDNIGKDDSLVAADDTGTMAQLAYAELLRSKATASVGTIETDMIKDALPGQWFYFNSADYRSTKIEHFLDPPPLGFRSKIYLTSDVTNGIARRRYEDLNKQYAAIRPEWQDRQASNIKAGSVDWRITRLTKDYA